MQKPPFKLANSLPVEQPDGPFADAHGAPARCDIDAACADAPPASRTRLSELDPHLHCSVIGTCLGTAELRKLMARYLFVRDSSDLEVHHEAVRMAAQGGPVVKALHKALDQRHEATLQRYAKTREPKAIATLWEEALKSGEIPGAYWAVLTHRHATAALRQKAFGDVHMLSHLVGAANRADIRRLVALERENEDLRERTERQQRRSQELAEERDRTIARLQQELGDADERRIEASRETASRRASADAGVDDDTLALVALQTERRERAEQAAAVAADEASRLREELAHVARHVEALNRELAAAETQLREIGDDSGASNRTLQVALRGRRVFYVGGRPSSTPAIRALVLRHGGDFQHHDGGLEDRKGLLASGIAWAHTVVFPVDCIDHDSAGNLKRICARLGVDYVPLRGASVASFAAALVHDDGHDEAVGPRPGCMKR